MGSVDNNVRNNSILIINRLIVVTCGLGPYSLAFPDDNDEEIRYIDNVMNVIFGIDIILNFLTAYHSADYSIVDHPRVKFTKLKKYSK